MHWPAAGSRWPLRRRGARRRAGDTGIARVDLSRHLSATWRVLRCLDGGAGDFEFGAVEPRASSSMALR